MSQRKSILRLCMLMSFLMISLSFADEVILKSGQKLEGKIVEKTDKYVKIDPGVGSTMTYYNDEIETINQENVSSGIKPTEVPNLHQESINTTDEINPNEILKKVKASYQSLQTYKTHGTVVADTNGMKLNTDFNILLKKPNLYLISWVQKMPMMAQAGAVWSDGTQPYLYMAMTNSYSKMNSDEMALSSATGISGGAAFTMPSIFLSAFQTPSSILDKLINPKLEGSEKVENEDCYIISGSSSVSKKETLWISKSKYLIKKYSRSLESPAGGRKMPKMTDEQMGEAIKAMGMKDSPEIRQKMLDDIKNAEKMSVNIDRQGSFTETYSDISSPETKKEDFQFQLPEGAVLKESLFGAMFNK